MYSEKNILFFNPYYFEEGGNKPKYFVVVKNIDDNIIIASLPTKEDHIPDSISKDKTKCINDEASLINCFFFKSKEIISECGKFSFPLDTFLYGETVKILSKPQLETIYQKEDIDYKILGRLSDSIYSQLLECFKNSTRVKRGIKKHLSL